MERRGKQAAYKRIVKRSIILFVIGILYSTGPVASLEDVRIMGVLQRIALSYLFAGLLFYSLKPRFLVIVFAAILVGYWAMMTFIPVPGVGAGNFQEGVNLANYVDQQYLPLKKYDGDYDPEGLLSTIPAIGTCLLGVFAGLLLRDEAVSDRERVKRLLLFGFASILLGLLWGTHFPVIKKIWTSSYVLVTGGCSFLLLAIFYQIIEIWKVRKWTKPFVWIGMNSITLYLVSGFLYMLMFFVFGLNFEAISGCGRVIYNLLYICLILTIAYALYRWKIFLRV
jgi:predicted acyltransferase